MEMIRELREMWYPEKAILGKSIAEFDPGSLCSIDRYAIPIAAHHINYYEVELLKNKLISFNYQKQNQDTIEF